MSWLKVLVDARIAAQKNPNVLLKKVGENVRKNNIDNILSFSANKSSQSIESLGTKVSENLEYEFAQVLEAIKKVDASYADDIVKSLSMVNRKSEMGLRTLARRQKAYIEEYGTNPAQIAERIEVNKLRAEARKAELELERRQEKIKEAFDYFREINPDLAEKVGQKIDDLSEKDIDRAWSFAESLLKRYTLEGNDINRYRTSLQDFSWIDDFTNKTYDDFWHNRQKSYIDDLF